MANATACIEISVDAYCTLSRVAAYIPRRTINDASIPTRRQVISLAKDVFQEINGLLDVLGYAIPVASSNGTAIRIVGRLNALGAAAAADASAYSAGNPQRSEHADYLGEQYKELYVKIEKGLMTIPAATRDGDYIPNKLERSIIGEFHQPNGTETTSTFTKDMNF
jgi:hypothetical protein